jgi:hypothetical protein
MWLHSGPRIYTCRIQPVKNRKLNTTTAFSGHNNLFSLITLFIYHKLSVVFFEGCKLSVVILVSKNVTENRVLWLSTEYVE